MPVKYILGSGDKIDLGAIGLKNAAGQAGKLLKVKTTEDLLEYLVQGSGGGLDSDFLDGLHAASFEQIANKGVANGYPSLNASSLVVQNPASKGQINGLAELDSGGKVPSSQLPALALTNVWTVASQAAQLALIAQEGDVAIRTDLNKSFAHNSGTTGTMTDWSELLTPIDTVLSVFGRTGAVVATKGDYILNLLGDVIITTPATAQVLRYSGTSWLNAQLAHSDLSGIGANTHAQLDTHLGASSGIHGVAGSVVGTSDVQTLLNKLLQSPKIKDVDTIPVGDILLKVMSGVLQARNSTDTTYAPLVLSQLAVGTPTVGGLINAVGDTSVLGALVRIQDTKAVPSGQLLFSFTNNTDTLFTVDNLGDVEIRRWLQWGEYNTAKYGRLAVPISDGFLGILAQGTDVNIDIEMRPKGTGKLIIGGGGTSASGEGHITILPWNYNNVIQGNWVFSMDALQILNGYFYNSTSVNLDQVDYKVYLAPGTYTFRLVYYKQSSNGIKDILIDGTSVGTIDGYSVSTVTNAVSSIIGIVVTTGGLKTLSVKVNGKNALSSGYQIVFTSIGLWRTA